MPIRTIATLAVAVFLGLVAVFLMQNWISGQRAADRQRAAANATVPVVVAAQPIARGVPLQPAVLRVAQYPQGAVPEGAFNSVEALTAGGARLALRPMSPNEPILAGRITQAGGKANLSAALTPGMRAVSFRSNDVAGVAGFVLPGDRVDVLLTRSVGENEKATSITQALAENVRVLGVDQTDDEALDKPQVARAITIEVSPEQAQEISLAQSIGSVSLALRQIGDQKPLDRHSTTIADLSGNPRARAAPTVRRIIKVSAPRAASNVDQIQVTRGVVTTGYSVVR
jgi:pilus assembly protein CpaB